MSISESINQYEKYFSGEYPIPEDMKEEWDDVLKWFEDTENKPEANRHLTIYFLLQSRLSNMSYKRRSGSG